MNRRDFLKGTAAAAVLSGMNMQAIAAEKQVQPRNRRPYQNLDWDKIHQVHTTSHGHCVNQYMLDSYLKRGFEFLTLSNYYPSAPYCPGKSMTGYYYRLHHDFPVVVNGKLTPGPFDWNKIIAPWADELPEKFRSQYPFKEGGLIFPNFPEGILEAPNAEHHGFIGSTTHMCAPGSAYCSGTFDAHNDFKTMSKGGYHFGTGLPWKQAIDKMIEGLIYPDGGGVTINHPNWSKLKQEHVDEILDYDPRVLGIEVFNQTTNPDEAYSEDYWDATLASGRQCFGFFVPDWNRTEGVNVLLVPEKNVHECLKAYRNGNFYGAIKGCGKLTFKKISFDGEWFTVEMDKVARIELISKRGVISKAQAQKFEYCVAPSDFAAHGYLRLKAYALDGSDEILFTQPIMLS